MNAINEEPEPQENEALLPWYAAGTLSRREADLVERALAGDSELASKIRGSGAHSSMSAVGATSSSMVQEHASPKPWPYCFRRCIG
jgi:anti-sigma-K factor RskA